MNLRFVLHMLGIVEIFLGLGMLISSLWGYYYSDGSSNVMILCGGCSFLLGIALFFAFRQFDELVTVRSAVFLVVAAWLVAVFTGSLPYFVARIFGRYSGASFINSLFESVSGFSTTGASVLGDPYPIEKVGKAILFWRQMTQWIGGLGIILMVISVFPLFGASGLAIVKAESFGLSLNKIQPRMITTVRSFGLVYLLITFIFIGFYLLGGLPVFDAMSITMAGLATGGFLHRDASIAAYGSSYVEWVTIALMFVSATNFMLHYSAIVGRINAYFKSSEFRFYLFWLLSASTIVVVSLYRSDVAKGFSSVGELVRSAVFQTVSLSSATGFVTKDFDGWPNGVRVIFLILMLFGGCLGSTSGGIKMFRLLLVIKSIFREIKRTLHPSLFVGVRYDGEVVHRNILDGVYTFFALYILIVLFATASLSLLGLDFTSSFSAVVTTMGGVGPGLGSVGPVKNFFYVPPLGKIILIMCMLFGRLEIIPLIAVVSPSFWRK